jgi:hypothetical protein
VTAWPARAPAPLSACRSRGRRVGRELDFGARAVAVDDDRAAAHFGELRAGRELRAERHRARRFAADADDRGAAVIERENAEQVDVLHGILVELSAEERGGVLGADRQRAAAAGSGASRADSVTTQ